LAIAHVPSAIHLAVSGEPVATMRAATSLLLAAAFVAPASIAAAKAPARIVLGNVHVVRASRALVADVSVGRGRHAGRVRSATVSCLGAVGRRPLGVHVGQLVDGKATCRWRFGGSARGKRFRGAIFVRSGRATAHAFVSARLR